MSVLIHRWEFVTINKPRNFNNNFHKKNQRWTARENVKNVTLIVIHILIIIMTFASSSTHFKTTPKSTQNHSNKHNSSLNNLRLHFLHWNTKNRLSIFCHSELTEVTDGAKIFEHACHDCTKNHLACDKCLQMVMRRNRTRMYASRYGRRLHEVKISVDVSCTK